MAINIGIFLYSEVEVLDFAGPFEVFSTASRVNARLAPESQNCFSVFTVAEKQKTMTTRGGLKIIPNYSISRHPEINVLIIPGGIITEELAKDPIVAWFVNTSDSADLMASVCTGAFLLAKAGLLSGKRATTHWEDIDDLTSMFPDIRVIRNVRWVDEGAIVTAAGISAGIDMSLHLVSRLAGKELAALTARQMEFDWTHNPLRRSS